MDKRVGELKKLNEHERKRIERAMKKAGYCFCGNWLGTEMEQETGICQECK